MSLASHLAKMLPLGLCVDAPGVSSGDAAVIVAISGHNSERSDEEKQGGKSAEQWFFHGVPPVV